jgi:hypothetical protein
LIALATAGCARRSLQADGGTGTIPVDAAGDGQPGDQRRDDAPAATDVGLPMPDLPPTPDANCGERIFRSARLAVDMMVVVDRAVSDRAKWNQFVADFASVTSWLNMEIAWGLKVFPEEGPACGAGTVSPRIDVPIAERDSSLVNTTLAGATPDGMGTPTAAAFDAALAYLESVSDISPKYMMLVTDGAPTCAGAAGALSNDAAQALADAEASIAAALARGYPTLVVGVGITAARDIAALNRLALAGGLPRTFPNELYYSSSNVDELRAVLAPIHETSCTFSLTPPAPDAGRIIVSIDNVLVPPDHNHINGWDFTSDAHTALTLYGQFCDTIVQAWEVEVRIRYVCP